MDVFDQAYGPVPMSVGLSGGMLCGSAATANMNLPFMLSSWGNEGNAPEEFSDMLLDMVQIDQQAQLFKNLPYTSRALEQRASLPSFMQSPVLPVQGVHVQGMHVQGSIPSLPLPHLPPHNPPNGKHSVDGHSGSGGHSTDSAEAAHGATSKTEAQVTRRAAVQKRYRMKKEDALHALQEQANQRIAEVEHLEKEKTALISKQSTLQKLVQCRDEQLTVLAIVRDFCRQDEISSGTSINRPAGVDTVKGAAGQGSGCFGKGDCAAPVQTDYDELMHYKTMTVDEVLSWWKQFVTSASQLLTQPAIGVSVVEMRGSPGSELQQLVSGVGARMKRIIQLNCSSLYTVMHLNLESGLPTSAPDTHWRAVLNLVELTDQQKLEILAMFELYQSLMDKVFEERRVLQVGMSQLDVHVAEDHHHHAYCNSNGTHLPEYMLPSGASAIEEMSFAEQLLLSLHKERSTRCLLSCFFFGKLLSPYQLAQAAVTSYPYFPEPLSLCRTLAGMEQPQGSKASSSHT